MPATGGRSRRRRSGRREKAPRPRCRSRWRPNGSSARPSRGRSSRRSRGPPARSTCSELAVVVEEVLGLGVAARPVARRRSARRAARGLGGWIEFRDDQLPPALGIASSCAWPTAKAIFVDRLETAAPSLIRRPSLTGRDPGFRLRSHSSLSRDRLRPISSNRSGPMSRKSELGRCMTRRNAAPGRCR